MLTVEQLEQWLFHTDKQLGLGTSSSIHQEVLFNVRPERIYEALTNAQQFSEITGGVPTDITPQAGAGFSLFGGMIQGRTIELVPNQQIVQAWRVANWEEGIYSLVKFTLIEAGNGTRLVFDQTGIPEDQKEHLDKGWHENYWKPLEKYFA
ncbi:MAG: hypothetical protein K0R47_2476 [Brevibacillus sp.]|jgi:activator of HSP90 ATPase|nr:hypothetical protein [Brevibacillus sp.]